VTAPAQPDLRQQIAAALSEAGAFCGECGFQPGETGCPDCVRVRELYTEALLSVVQPLLDQRDAENARLRAEIRDWLGLRDARMSLQAFRHAIGSTATQITDLIHGIGRATGPLARAQREAAHYRARWASTVVEARRQAARAEAAEQSKAEIITLCHAAIYHSGGPSCPAPNTCPTALAAAPSATT
jgi:hypothetical protein